MQGHYVSCCICYGSELGESVVLTIYKLKNGSKYNDGTELEIKIT